MKIKFTKKRLIYNLVLSILYLTIGLEGIIYQENIRWTKYGMLSLGILYLTNSLYELKYQYLSIEYGILRKNMILGFTKKINLNDIIEIKTVAGDYTLLTDTTQLKIQVELIVDDSLLELNRILSELDLPSDKTPFQNTKIE